MEALDTQTTITYHNVRDARSPTGTEPGLPRPGSQRSSSALSRFSVSIHSAASVSGEQESPPGEERKNFILFWSGVRKLEGIVRSWQTRLRKLFKLANIPDGHAHRFRDTFAVELLLAGVPIERVSVLLGHQSVRITEKHYAPWVRSRQEQLEADLVRAWDRDPLVLSHGEVHAGYIGDGGSGTPAISIRNNGARGGSRTPWPH